VNPQFNTRKERLSLFQKLFPQRAEAVKSAADLSIVMCPSCNHPISQYDLNAQDHVCPGCRYHFPLGVQDRLKTLVDPKSFKELYRSANSLKINSFPDYDRKLHKAQELTGLKEAVACGIAEIEGEKIALAIMDSRFIMGSMGQIVGEKITRLIEVATKKKLPLVIFTASGGARMQEGILSLFQMAKTSAALARYDEAGGFYITVLTHPTTGGVSASFAMLGDIILAEPKALIGFAGRRVIEKTINQQLPEAFQTAEFLLERGFVDRIVDRTQLRETLGQLLKLHRSHA
jgi:acetyl-CoA carboxylase carboxyl transferase subunit beta